MADCKVVMVGWWRFYTDGNPFAIDIKNCGKWMYFFKDDDSLPRAICQKAIEEGACVECKHTDLKRFPELKTGVVCFYCDRSDKDAMQRILVFMRDNGLIQRKKNGEYFNIPFKLDSQTDDKKYGKDFVATVRLKDYMNPVTGELL